MAKDEVYIIDFSFYVLEKFTSDVIYLYITIIFVEILLLESKKKKIINQNICSVTTRFENC